MKYYKQIFESRLIRNFLIYSFGALFLKGVSFLLIPLYTKVLTPAEYGNLDLLSTFSGLLDVVLSLGMSQVLFIEFYHQNSKMKKILLNKLLSIFISISLSLYVLVFLFTIVLKNYLFPDIKIYLIAVVMITTYLTFFQGLLIIILKLTTKAFQVTVLQVIAGLLSVLLNVLFVYYLKTGIDGIVWSGFIAMMLSTFYGLYLFTKKMKTFNFSLDYITTIHFLKLGLPFIPNALSLWMMSSANRWILRNYTDADEVGFYAVAFKFSSLFDPLLIQPFLSAYAPKILKQFSEGNYKQNLKKYFLLSLLFFSLVGFVTQWIAYWVIDIQFNAALKLIPIITFGYAFYFFTQIAAMILVYKKRVNEMLLCIAAGSIISVFFSFILTPVYGGIGSALGTVIGYSIWMILIVIYALKEKKKLVLVN